MLSGDSPAPQHSRPPPLSLPAVASDIVPVLLTHIIHDPNCVAVPSPFWGNLSHLSSHWDSVESHVNDSVLQAASLGPSDITPCPAVAAQAGAGTAGARLAVVTWQEQTHAGESVSHSRAEVEHAAEGSGERGA